MKITTEASTTQDIYSAACQCGDPFTATLNTEVRIRVQTGTITTGATNFTITVYQDAAKADFIVYTASIAKPASGDTAGFYYTIPVPFVLKAGEAIYTKLASDNSGDTSVTITAVYAEPYNSGLYVETTAYAGSSTTSLVLATGITFGANDYPIGLTVYVEDADYGFGACSKIVDWDNSTRTATLSPALPFTPAADDPVVIYKNAYARVSSDGYQQVDSVKVGSAAPLDGSAIATAIEGTEMDLVDHPNATAAADIAAAVDVQIEDETFATKQDVAGGHRY